MDTHKNLNIGQTRNLLLGKGTIIVLKITLLNCKSVSVFTNSIIQSITNKKTSHFSVWSWHATYNSHQTWRGDREGLSHFAAG